MSKVLDRVAQTVSCGAATLPLQEKNNSADVQRSRERFTRVQRRISRMRVIVIAAHCSPAVASRRAKYVNDFRVPTLLGAQPLDARYFSDGCSRLGPSAPKGVATSRQARRSHNLTASPGAMSADPSPLWERFF